MNKIKLKDRAKEDEEISSAPTFISTTEFSRTKKEDLLKLLRAKGKFYTTFKGIPIKIQLAELG